MIPTYQRRRWVCRAVESVLAQTRPPDEVIVVDDGSTDGTADELVRRYRGRVRVLVQPNRGVAAARNEGVRAARHGLVAFLDSDDCWLPGKLELQLPLHEDPAVVVSLTNWSWRRRPESGAFEREGLVLAAPRTVDRAPLAAIARVGGTRFLVQTAICRRDALLRVGGFDERMRFCEDTRFLLRMAFEGAFGLVAQPLLLREEGVPGTHLSRPVDLAARAERGRNAVELLLETYARACDAPPELQRELRRLVAYHLCEQARALAAQGNLRLARRRAFESLAFHPRGKTALRSLAGLLVPRLLPLQRPRRAAAERRRPWAAALRSPTRAAE